MIEIDTVLEKCGDFNRYQFIILTLFCIVNMLASMHYYSQTIISFSPEFWCHDDSLVNLTINEIKSVYENVKDPSCTKLNSDEPCTKWIYNYDYEYDSMVTDLNWVCKSAWKSSTGQSIYFVGSVIGTLLFGILSDKIGRVPILIIANICAIVGNILTIFAQSLLMFSICRFISGLATDSNFVMMYILVMEYLRPSMRTYGLSICIGVFYCIGAALTPWIAVGVGNWKLFLLVITIPMAIIPIYCFFIVESSQWLVTNRQYDKAVKCLKKVAKINKRDIDETVFDQFVIKCAVGMAATKKSPSFVGLFKTPRLRRNTFILFFKSMVITLCYDAVSRNVEGLSISPFIMFTLSATSILPACLLIILLQDKIGRKAMSSFSLLLSGFFITTSGIVLAYKRTNNPFMLVALKIIGRFGVTVAYNSSAQYATELIPTCVRGQGISIVHVFGYAFTFFSIYILYLHTYYAYLPSIILGILSFIGSILCLLLPETLNKTLPATLEQGEEFGKNEKIFYFSWCDKKRSISTTTLQT